MIILYIQKGIKDFFPEILKFSFVDFHFKKFGKGEDQNIFVKKYGFIVCKRSALKKLSHRKKLKIQSM